MGLYTWGWIGIIFIFIGTTIGFFWFTTVIFCLLMFVVGYMSVLVILKGDTDRYDRKKTGKPLPEDMIIKRGLNRKLNANRSKPKKLDKRITGSDLIDKSLQDILGYLIRDYVLPWYSQFSADTEFPNITLKETAQLIAINLSNRVKDVDWIPYLTTRLVDEGASHLRLFKQAQLKAECNSENIKKSPSPRFPPKLMKQNSHKRNKSEADATCYTTNSTENNAKEANKRKNSMECGDSMYSDSVENAFFDLECKMENNLISRKGVCMDIANEKDFLREFIQVLLYLLLPEDDFNCKLLRYLLRELTMNCVLVPLFNMLADPDYINQLIIWLCLGNSNLSSDTFLMVLRKTNNCDELKSTKLLILHEIQQLRSRDSGGQDDLQIKQQLSSLFYVLKLIDNGLAKMDTFGRRASIESVKISKCIDLSLSQILRNNIALSYFIDFVSSREIQNDLFFFLNIEGWKISVERQLYEPHSTATLESIRSTALSIFGQYLGEDAEQKVQISPNAVQKLYFRIRNLNDTPNERWFDEIQRLLHDKMENHDDFLPAFKTSRVYLKLLQELDLIPTSTCEEDAISVDSSDSGGETRSLHGITEKLDYLTASSSTGGLNKSGKHTRSFSDITMLSKCKSDTNLTQHEQSSTELNDCDSCQDVLTSLKTGEFTFDVVIIEAGVVCEKGKTFGVYALRVKRKYESNFEEEWHIYRRYSDFHDLNTKIKEKFPDLGKLPFPAKKAFHNMDRPVLEKRMKILNSYIATVCSPVMVSTHCGIVNLLSSFLEQGDYDRATGGPISTTIDILVNPLKKTIKNMPEHLINTYDEFMGGIAKVFHHKTDSSLPEASKVGAAIEETDDNIPLRILLLLMDEVFDLKSRNQWLRRRIVTLLRQIIHAIFGDIVNRRIVEYVSVITSAESVACYIELFKNSMWPNGVKYKKKPDRDPDTKHRTRIVAKIALLSCLSDELKRIVGSETTRQGLLTVFELFQRPILNRRLIYVLLEGIVCTLFPERDMFTIFQKLHCKTTKHSALQSYSDSDNHR